MIALRSPELFVRLDPAHGGEILDLVDLASGRQLLGRPPFGSLPPAAGDLDETRWTASYRGGWQTVLPNAGNPCALDGEQHGFHGRASSDPWSVVDERPDAATLAWSGHGLEVEKRIALEDGAVAVRYRIRALREAALVALEHFTVGLDLLEPEVAIDLPGGRAYELGETAGPASPPDDAAAWPEVRLEDGPLERADTWPIDEPRSRFYVVADVKAGWAAVRNPAHGQGVALTWDVGWFRRCWVWHENRVWGDPWRGLTELLAIEPATVPHPLGVAAAAAHGQAVRLLPGEEARPWIVARAFSATGPVADVDDRAFPRR